MTPESPEGGRRLRLTNLGLIAMQNGVLTPPSWWRQQVADALREAELSGEWELLLQERIEGLGSLIGAITEHGFDWLALFAESPEAPS